MDSAAAFNSKVDSLVSSGASELLIPREKLGRPIMGIHLIVTDACNMGCSYCFYWKKKNYLSEENGRATMDWLTDPAISGDRKDVHVTFFGGEPTLNEALMMDTVTYGKQIAQKRGKHITFGVVSNFLKISDDFFKFCVDNGLSFLASYDGFRAQDINRRKGSHNKVLRNIVHAMDMGVKLMIAQQVSPGNTANLYDDLISIFDIGVNHVFQNPVHHGIRPYDEEDFWNLNLAFEKEAKLIIKKRRAGVTVADWSISNMEAHLNSAVGLVRNQPRMKEFLAVGQDRTCGACKGSLSVAVDGSIRPCQQMTTEYEQYTMGHVTDAKFRSDIREQFKTIQFEECKGCAIVKCAPCRTQNAYATGSEACVPEDVCRYQRLMNYHCTLILNELSDLPQYDVSGKVQSPASRRPQQGQQRELKPGPCRLQAQGTQGTQKSVPPNPQGADGGH